jgi:hypothetical protein
MVPEAAVTQFISNAAEATGLEDPTVLANLLSEEDRQTAVRATINGDMAQLTAMAEQAKGNAAAYVASPEFAASVAEAGAELRGDTIVFDDGHTEDALAMLLSNRIEFI